MPHSPLPLGDFPSVLRTWPNALLNDFALFVNGELLLLREIEIYYHSPDHPDPFPHRYPLQKECGAWYFHRTGNSFRGGSYKGLDLTIGNEGDGIYCGILFRALERPDGSLVQGPSLCVDYLLAVTATSTVSELDRRANALGAFEEDNPLSLRPFSDRVRRSMFQTARVGLSLKRAALYSEMPKYWGAPYRFATGPKELRKGRVQTIIAMHRQGFGEPAIRAETNGTARLIRDCLAEYRKGEQESDFTPWFGRALSSKEWCRVMGIWQSRYGEEFGSDP
jgi:hypothetical protein